MSTYQSTRGQPLKIFKKRYRLRIRGHFFSNRVVDSWNDLLTDVVTAPSLNTFKTRLIKCWKGHPYKFEPWWLLRRRYLFYRWWVTSMIFFRVHLTKVTTVHPTFWQLVRKIKTRNQRFFFFLFYTKETSLPNSLQCNFISTGCLILEMDESK